eukprot:322817_1
MTQMPPSVHINPQSRHLISAFQHPSNPSQPLKPHNSSTHSKNVFFIEGLKKLMEKYKGEPGLEPLQKIMGYTSVIFDQGGIIDLDSWVFYFPSKIGTPQYGKTNKAVYTEVLPGTVKDWVQLQRHTQWRTPIDYINIMEESLREKGDLSNWWNKLDRMYANKFGKKKNNNKNKHDNASSLISDNNNVKQVSQKKRTYNQMENKNYTYHIPPPPPIKKQRTSYSHPQNHTINIYDKKCNNNNNNNNYQFEQTFNSNKYDLTDEYFVDKKYSNKLHNNNNTFCNFGGSDSDSNSN